MTGTLEIADREIRPLPIARAAGNAAQGGQLLTGSVRVLLTEQEAGVETADGERVHARQAASCLLAPAIGDRVLLYTDGGEAHILAVLERGSDHAAEVSVPGARHVVLRSSEKLELSAPKVTVAARDINLLARTISQTGEVLSSSFKRILESVVDKTVGARTITTRAMARTAAIREVDTLNVGTLIQNIDKIATQNSEISLVTAKQDVRLDAKRVSVG